MSVFSNVPQVVDEVLPEPGVAPSEGLLMTLLQFQPLGLPGLGFPFPGSPDVVVVVAGEVPPELRIYLQGVNRGGTY